MFYKESVLKNFRRATLLKRDSNAGAFLWILQDFQEHLFWRTASENWVSYEPHTYIEFRMLVSKKTLLQKFSKVYSSMLDTFQNTFDSAFVKQIWQKKISVYCYYGKEYVQQEKQIAYYFLSFLNSLINEETFKDKELKDEPKSIPVDLMKKESATFRWLHRFKGIVGRMDAW